MAVAVFRKYFAMLALVAVAWTIPASAQFQSDGYKFLEAVKDRDGAVVTEALKEPGSVVVNTRDFTTGETALHIVVKRRDTVWIRFLTSYGANPNVRDRKGVTPLQLASTLGSIEAVEALLEAGAEVDDTNVAGETALIAAVHRRDTGLVRLLLSKGANPDRSDNSGRTARDYADLQNSNGQLLSEFKKADEDRAKADEPKSYGPIF